MDDAAYLVSAYSEMHVLQDALSAALDLAVSGGALREEMPEEYDTATQALAALEVSDAWTVGLRVDEMRASRARAQRSAMTAMDDDNVLEMQRLAGRLDTLDRLIADCDERGEAVVLAQYASEVATLIARARAATETTVRRLEDMTHREE